MKEVAKRAGVSIATVSAVINESKYVSDELKKRINEAIIELDYRPNRNARGLKGKETNLIGVTVTELTNPFYPLMVQGIEESAHEKGYNMVLAATSDLESKELTLLESMADQRVDGIILTTVDHHNSNILKFIQKEGIPVVLINRAPKDYKGPLVCVDSIRVGRIATEHLISLNHQDIAFFGGKRHNSIEREIGYQEAMQSRGLVIRDEWKITNTAYDPKKAYQLASSLIESSNPTPTAVFAASDVIAFGVARAFLDAGYRIPEDISIIGADNVPFSQDFRVSLSTVDVQPYQMGAEGYRLLENLIYKSNEEHNVKKYLEPSLVIRESTGPLA
ncbi:LacI family DNA-binding transcriptional regulator [Salsuginibacillus kocurii]|uniref:LacI family DNA-binding transcriptional regulator n=1 Tax=Salsuginibacillus kocurii TaxID=427078 RepID=UPI0003646302|nr:LacI family DNA-binding transcriptional regulator [Salsuginibacillus kocurii]